MCRVLHSVLHIFAIQLLSQIFCPQYLCRCPCCSFSAVCTQLAPTHVLPCHSTCCVIFPHLHSICTVYVLYPVYFCTSQLGCGLQCNSFLRCTTGPFTLYRIHGSTVCPGPVVYLARTLKIYFAQQVARVEGCGRAPAACAGGGRKYQGGGGCRRQADDEDAR